MAVKDLAETMATSETWISVWYDDEEHEVYFQYGYVDVSMTIEDFRDFVETLVKAEEKLGKK
ncbi:hypothetical protein HYR54_16495 [Candidatus Acetothermia bacterium]|nr:hypothetical protein [Candidatus Acetothermia bacterium]